LYNNNSNNTSQRGSRFRGVLGDPTVGNLTLTSIYTRREAVSKRPTKKDFETILKKKDFVKTFNEKLETHHKERLR